MTKTITFTKATDTDCDGDVRATYFEVRVAGVLIGAVQKDEGDRMTREPKTMWISPENPMCRRTTRTELVNEMICAHFGLVPADNYWDGMKRTVAEFLAA